MRPLWCLCFYIDPFCMILPNYSGRMTYLRLLQGICLPALLAFLLSACGTARQYTYLKNITKDTTIKNFVTNDFESKIVPGDQLSIKATSLSPAEDEQFNKAAAEFKGIETGGIGYLVDQDGKVQLHRLGKVPVAGLTRRQLEEKLENDLLLYMKEPIVNVQYLNHKVTVMGAVGNPQVIQMPEEQLNIFEVLIKSGDITQTGMKNRVMVIREENNDKKVRYLNLEDQAVFNNPWFYIKPNDIVYVPDDKSEEIKDEKRQKLLTAISLVTTAVTFSFLVIDRIIR
jgi:polysaccharide export outer membrane protein